MVSVSASAPGSAVFCSIEPDDSSSALQLQHRASQLDALVRTVDELVTRRVADPEACERYSWLVDLAHERTDELLALLPFGRAARQLSAVLRCLQEAAATKASEIEQADIEHVTWLSWLASDLVLRVVHSIEQPAAANEELQS